MASQRSLMVGLIGTAVFVPAVFGHGLARWIGAISSLAFLSCLYHIVRPSPMVLATQEALFVGIGRFGHLFRVPWEHVEGVVLTEVAVPGPDFAVRKAALGLVIRQDDGFRLPVVLWNSSGSDEGPPYSDVTFSTDMIEGNIEAWVEKLEAFRKEMRRQLPKMA